MLARDGTANHMPSHPFALTEKSVMPAKQFTLSWLLLAVLTTTAAAESPGLTPLFDGKSLRGLEGNQKYFRVQDGCIVAGTLKEKIPHNEFLCTEKSFGDFELTFEAKLVGPPSGKGGDNAGVQFRSRRVPDSTEVSGYQADIGTAWDRSVWGALYDESRRRKMLAEPAAELGERIVQPGDWNRMKVRCQGKHIQIFVNDTLTVDYIESDPEIETDGIIGLQIHSGPPSEAWYRNIHIRAL